MTPTTSAVWYARRRSVRDFPRSRADDILDQLIADAAWAAQLVQHPAKTLITIATGAVRDRLAGELCAPTPPLPHSGETCGTSCGWWRRGACPRATSTPR